MGTSKNWVVTTASCFCSALGFWGFWEKVGWNEIQMSWSSTMYSLVLYNDDSVVIYLVSKQKLVLCWELCYRVSEWLRAINQEANRWFLFSEQNPIDEWSRAKTRAELVRFCLFCRACSFISGWTRWRALCVVDSCYFGISSEKTSYCF